MSKIFDTQSCFPILSGQGSAQSGTGDAAMKIFLSIVVVTVLLVGGVYVTHSSQGEYFLPGHFTQSGHLPPGGLGSQEGASNSEESVTFSIRQNDFDLCEDAFYVGLYDLSIEVFAVGAENVDVADYQRQIFHYIRTTDTFTMGDGASTVGDREAWVDHVKDIPGQLVEIIREDPAVVDSCANFSVALVGPP